MDEDGRGRRNGKKVEGGWGEEEGGGGDSSIHISRKRGKEEEKAHCVCLSLCVFLHLFVVSSLLY